MPLVPAGRPEDAVVLLPGGVAPSEPGVQARSSGRTERKVDERTSLRRRARDRRGSVRWQRTLPGVERRSERGVERRSESGSERG
jgi:hypothetical protein